MHAERADAILRRRPLTHSRSWAQPYALSRKGMRGNTARRYDFFAGSALAIH